MKFWGWAISKNCMPQLTRYTCPACRKPWLLWNATSVLSSVKLNPHPMLRVCVYIIACTSLCLALGFGVHSDNGSTYLVWDLLHIHTQMLHS